MGNIKTRLQRIERVKQASEPVHISVAHPDGDGVRCGDRHFTLAEWETYKAESKRKGEQWIEVTPESIARRTGGGL